MHVLVTVGSRHGSTREIGAGIAQVLERGGTHTVDQVDPDEVTSLAGYDAVVLGSAIYVDRLAESVRALVLRLGGALHELPVWLFWSGPIGLPLRPHGTPDDVDQLVRQLAPRGVRMFGGRLASAELDLAERSQVGPIEAPPGDYRDFETIDRWAEEIAVALSPRSARGTVVPPSGEWRGLAQA